MTDKVILTKRLLLQKTTLQQKILCKIMPLLYSPSNLDRIKKQCCLTRQALDLYPTNRGPAQTYYSYYLRNINLTNSTKSVVNAIEFVRVCIGPISG